MHRSSITRRARQVAALIVIVLRLAGLGLGVALPSLPAWASDAAATLDRAETQVRVDPALSARLAQQALASLGDQGDADLRVRALLLLCEHLSERDSTAARERLAQARALLPQVRQRGLSARAYGCEGELESLAGQGAAALRLFELAVAAAERAQDDAALAEALYQRGYLRGVRGEFSSGLTDLDRAATLFDRLGQVEMRTTTQNSIATVYNRMGDAEQARRYYRMTLQEQQRTGLKRELVVTWHNLGRVNEQLADWPAAEEAFQQTLTLARELRYARGEAYGLRGLAALANARGDPALALQRLDAAQALQRGLADERLRGQVLLQRGVALRSLGRMADARLALLEALRIFEQAESTRERAQAHEALAALHAAQGQWREAYAQLEAFKRLSDGLLQRQVDERFAALKLQVDRSSEAQHLRLLQREQDATAHALAQERLAGQLRNGAIVVGVIAAALLAALAWRLRRVGRAMQRLAHTDELTGLPNRRDVLARLDAMLARGTRSALLIIDLDHFKRINDSHGHPAGDAVLRAAAEVLRAEGAPPAAAGRLGGEEFVLVLPGVDEAGACAVAERIRAAVAALDLGAVVPEGHVTTSVGLTLGQAGDDISALLRRADRALYLAKARGRNRVEVVRAEEELSAEASPPVATTPDRSPPSSPGPRTRPAA
ncbi:MAG: GGDEF domain-containing protein [Burkholderiaceae bacterium]|nr:GGDEF domain-containing protein [Burkholderiaceae bacterium]